jgi:hypothetical protein
MAMTMVQPGRRLFTTAAVLMLLTASAHTVGFLSSGGTPAEQQMLQSMDSLRGPMGMGMSPSLRDIFYSLAFTMSVTFAALGVMNLVLAASRLVPDSVLRTVGWVNVIWVGAFVTVSWKYQVPPPLMSGAAIEVVLLAYVLMPQREGR